MEFPSLGEHCQYQNCNQTDFLPLQCKCGNVFCREHFNSHCLSGDCELAPKPKEVNLKNDDQIFKCSEKGCRKGNLHEMLCGKCNEHFCIEHRFHPSCPEIDDETMAAKIEQIDAPKRQFREANKHLQEKITENIRKALQSSAKVKTASKIHLMRIKQKSIGPNIKPLSSRVYFAIKKPANMDPKPVKVIQCEENIEVVESVSLDPDLKDTIATFVSTQWSLGKAIDSICETCNIQNDNNKIDKMDDAARKRKSREKLMSDPEKWRLTLEKEKKRDQVRRQKKSKELLQNKRKLDEKRQADRIRQRRCRDEATDEEEENEGRDEADERYEPVKDKNEKEINEIHKAGCSGLNNPQYNNGNHVLVKFPGNKIEYRYVGIINQINYNENEEPVVTFLRMTDKAAKLFKIVDNDISEIPFEQIVEKLPNPSIVQKGGRLFYKFVDSVNIYEK